MKLSILAISVVLQNSEDDKMLHSVEKSIYAKYLEKRLLPIEKEKLRTSGTSLKYVLFWRKQRNSKPQLELSKLTS